MTILILERVTASLRGDLSRWLIEVQPGVFTGKINETVRVALWERAKSRADSGTVTMIWRTNNEQGFDLCTWQPENYIPVNVEGVWLTMRPAEAPVTKGNDT